MVRPIAVEPRGDYRLGLRYSDGAAGEIDLSPLAGQGVFAAWEDPACFAAVRLAEHGAIVWGDDLELCPAALYLQRTGKPLSAIMPDARAGPEPIAERVLNMPPKKPWRCPEQAGANSLEQDASGPAAPVALN